MCTVESCLQYYDGDKLTHRIVSFCLGILLTRCLRNAAADEQACYSKEVLTGQVDQDWQRGDFMVCMNVCLSFGCQMTERNAEVAE